MKVRVLVTIHEFKSEIDSYSRCVKDSPNEFEVMGVIGDLEHNQEQQKES